MWYISFSFKKSRGGWLDAWLASPPAGFHAVEGFTDLAKLSTGKEKKSLWSRVLGKLIVD